MAAAPETPQVIEAACLPLRQDRLDQLLVQLEMCEKALQVCQLSLVVSRLEAAG